MSYFISSTPLLPPPTIFEPKQFGDVGKLIELFERQQSDTLFQRAAFFCLATKSKTLIDYAFQGAHQALISPRVEEINPLPIKNFLRIAFSEQLGDIFLSFAKLTYFAQLELISTLGKEDFSLDTLIFEHLLRTELKKNPASFKTFLLFSHHQNYCSPLLGRKTKKWLSQLENLRYYRDYMSLWGWALNLLWQTEGATTETQKTIRKTNTTVVELLSLRMNTRPVPVLSSLEVYAEVIKENSQKALANYLANCPLIAKQDLAQQHQKFLQKMEFKL